MIFIILIMTIITGFVIFKFSKKPNVVLGTIVVATIFFALICCFYRILHSI